jgi:solute carrier family 10 (sodium/bile acid cotransporter), member 7
MALVLFPAATVGLSMLPLMIFHQIQLVVCSVIASRLGRASETGPEAQPATGAATGWVIGSTSVSSEVGPGMGEEP